MIRLKLHNTLPGTQGRTELLAVDVSLTVRWWLLTLLPSSRLDIGTLGFCGVVVHSVFLPQECTCCLVLDELADLYYNCFTGPCGLIPVTSSIPPRFIVHHEVFPFVIFTKVCPSET